MIFTSGIICVPNPILLAHAVDVDFEYPQKATFQELTKQVERPGREAVAAPQIGLSAASSPSTAPGWGSSEGTASL